VGDSPAHRQAVPQVDVVVPGQRAEVDLRGPKALEGHEQQRQERQHRGGAQVAEHEQPRRKLPPAHGDQGCARSTPPIRANRPLATIRRSTSQATTTMVMSTRLMLSAVMRSGGYFRVTACTMDTGSTSICAEVPITTGTENSAKPMVMS